MSLAWPAKSEEEAYALGVLTGGLEQPKKGGAKLQLGRGKKRLVRALRQTLNTPIRQRADAWLLPKQALEHPLVQAAVSPELAKLLPEANSSLLHAFVRGLFEATGDVVDDLASPLSCRLTVRQEFGNALLLRYPAAELSPAGAYLHLTWYGTNALDVLGYLYEAGGPRDTRFEERYRAWCRADPWGSQELSFDYSLLVPEAVAPYKPRVSDSGYDLTLVREVKRWGRCVLFGTGLQLRPPRGWYFDVVPRSSIIKLGYIAANSVGVIDRSYRGEVMVPLIKIDDAAPDLVLPARVAQLIPRPIVHLGAVQLPSLDSTLRGEGGFGSSG